MLLNCVVDVGDVVTFYGLCCELMLFACVRACVRVCVRACACAWPDDTSTDTGPPPLHFISHSPSSASPSHFVISSIHLVYPHRHNGPHPISVRQYETGGGVIYLYEICQQ